MPAKFLSILFLLISLFSFAQKKIKYEVGKNSDTTWQTNEVKIYTKSGPPNALGEILSSTAYKTNGTYMLSFYIRTGRTSVFSVYKGAGLELKLADGNSVVIKCLADNTSRSSSMGYGSFTYGYYKVSASAVQQLKNSIVSTIRIQTSTGNFDYEIKEKFGDTIAEQLNAIAER